MRRRVGPAALAIALALASTQAHADAPVPGGAPMPGEEARVYKQAAEQWKAIADFRQRKNEALQEWLTKCTETTTTTPAIIPPPQVVEVSSTPGWLWPTVALTAILGFAGGFLLSSSSK